MKQKFKIVTGLLVGVVMSMSAYSQSTTVYSLQQCVDIALKNNMDVLNAGFREQNAEANLIQSKAGLFPTLNANINHGINQGRSINPYTNSYLDQTLNTAQYNLSAGVTLWNGSSTVNAIKQGQQSLEGAKMDLQQAKNDLTINVILAYLLVLNNQDQLALANNQAEVSRQQVERLTLLDKDGAIAPATLYDQKGQLGSDELSIIGSKNALESSKIALCQLMNIPYSADMRLEKIDVTALARYSSSIEEVYSAASKGFASVQAAAFKTRAAVLGVKVARGYMMPTLSLNASLGTNYSSAANTLKFLSTTDIATSSYVTVNNVKTTVYTSQDNFESQKLSYGSQWKNNLNSYIGIGLQIPIFNAARLKTQYKLAKITEQQTVNQEKTTNLRLKQAIDLAYINMNTAFERYQVLERQAADYAVSFRAATSKFEAGVITSVDYIIAKNNLDRANTNLIAAKYDYILKTKVLDYYQGLK
ncbi:MAG: TolC family protein [Chitinophagaceae bacterium]|nr:TolC family protein [Chitinophagaceae bacterium]